MKTVLEMSIEDMKNALKNNYHSNYEQLLRLNLGTPRNPQEWDVHMKFTKALELAYEELKKETKLVMEYNDRRIEEYCN